MVSRMSGIAPRYHVQSTAAQSRNGFPYFERHDSVSALWRRKWRKLCAGGIYPFTDADVADFDPVFEELVRISGDDAGILYRPDDYAEPFLPVGLRLVAQAEERQADGDAARARALFLRAAAVTG